MSRSFYGYFVLLFGAALLLATAGFAADVPLTMVKAPGGGQISFGPLSGQMTPEAAMGNLLHRVSVYCGDRPVMGKPVQGDNGDILEVFFTVTGKNQDGKPMAGLAIVSAPKNDIARAAVLSDYADTFPTTVNSMFALLKQRMGTTPAPAASSKQSAPSGGSSATAAPAAKPKTSGTAAAPAKAGPAQPLVLNRFPDGTGAIGLPAGWKVVHAQKGDVGATGTRGETLRFGWTIAVIDPTNPASKTLMGRGGTPPNFVAIPFGTDPTNAFKSGITQLAQKSKMKAPVVHIGTVQEIPLQGGKNYILYGDIDFGDGKGAQSLVLQMIDTPPEPMGTWQTTWYQFMAPQQVMADEGATVAAIISSYSTDPNRINVIVNQQIQVGIQQTNNAIAMVQQYTDSSDQMTQGMSDFLRGQSVVVDTQTGEHARTSDQLSDALVQANPNRYQTLSTGQYIKGIDY
jgi:hypothetical protein